MQNIKFLSISIMSINLVSVYIFCIIVSVTVKKDCFTHIHHAYMLSKILYLQIYTHFIKELGIYKSHAEFTTIVTTFFLHFKSVKYTWHCILTQPKGASMRPQDHTAHIGQSNQGLIKSLKILKTLIK